MADKFIRSVQEHLANSYGISAARRMGPPGTIRAVRKFLKTIDLASVAAGGAPSYLQTLDRLTEDLRRALPWGGKRWGTARKALNLFFRDAVYNHFLRERFALGRLERALEVPLDSLVGRGLRSEAEGHELPRWQTVKGLTPAQSAAFQRVADRVAKRERVARVHLDLKYWQRDTEM